MTNKKNIEILNGLKNILTFYIEQQDTNKPYFKYKDLPYEILGNFDDIRHDLNAKDSIAIDVVEAYVYSLIPYEGREMLVAIKIMRDSINRLLKNYCQDEQPINDK